MQRWGIAQEFLLNSTPMESDTQVVIYAVLAALVAAYLVRWSSHPVSTFTAVSDTSNLIVASFGVASFNPYGGWAYGPCVILPWRLELLSQREEANLRGLSTGVDICHHRPS